ncbi:MAG: hypothetical protein OFPI_09650 [Osedax symbiont Rs2]|nr:MAG: hypothetical protein OFPI_09650 [Osedax symbiont Rs2]
MKSRTVPYLIGLFFDGISSGLFMLALPWIMLKSPDMGTFVAIIALICTVTTFFITPYMSSIIDRFSRKKILVWIQIIQLITALLVCAIYSTDFNSSTALAIPQLIFWVSTNVAWHVNNAFTQENFAKHEYAKISGYQEVVVQSSMMGAGALGIVLLERWGITEFSFFAATASVIAVISYLMIPYNRQLRDSKKSPMLAQMKQIQTTYSTMPTYYTFILISCLSYPVLTMLSRLIPIWFSELNISGDWFATYNIALGLGSLITGLLLSWILSFTSHKNIMQYSIILLALILLIMGELRNPFYIVTLTIGFGFFNALNRIARINWMHHTVPLHQRGRIDGGLAMFTTLAQSLSYVLIAYLSHINAIEQGFVVIGLIMLVCGLWMVSLGKRMDKNQSLIPKY